MSTAQQRLAFAKSILNFEARRDSQRRLRIYELPVEDGGGTYEVAGINERYHPEEAARLADLIRAGHFEKAEMEATEFIARFTDGVADWSADPGVECYLRDCAFNRGPRGAARILQRALGIPDDGKVGPITREAADKADNQPKQLLQAMRVAREQYERDVVHRDETSIFWNGLVNRWNKALETAKSFAGAVTPESALRAESATGTIAPNVLTPHPAVVCENCTTEESHMTDKPKVDRWEPTSHQSSRNNTDIDHIVIHYTTSRNIEGSISWFKHGSPRTSAHYIVGRDGALVQMVNDSDRAWHAGNSAMNARSIGIEHVAAPGDEIAELQAATSIALIAWLMQEYEIPKANVIPHCCVKSTSCCGDLFARFGGGAGKTSDAQKRALHDWMSSLGVT